MKFSVSKLSNTLKSKYKVIEIAYIFGSSRDGVVSSGSDVDIAVVVDQTALQKNPMIGLEMETELQDLYKCDVDVVVLNKANAILRYEVLSTGNRLFEKDSTKRALSELCYIKDYFDTKYYQQKRNGYGKQANNLSASK